MLGVGETEFPPPFLLTCERSPPPPNRISLGGFPPDKSVSFLTDRRPTQCQGRILSPVYFLPIKSSSTSSPFFKRDLRPACLLFPDVGECSPYGESKGVPLRRMVLPFEGPSSLLFFARVFRLGSIPPSMPRPPPFATLPLIHRQNM